MALSVPSEVVSFDILDAPFVHVTRRDVPRRNERPQPGGGERVVFVVVGGHHFAPLATFGTPSQQPSSGEVITLLAQ